MILDDKSLLLRYVGARDAEAFSELVQRYSTMVYSVACRVTVNAAAAEDVTQDCFFTLARQAATVRGSLPAWLHRVALNRSLEVARSDGMRQKREAKVSAHSKTSEEPTWHEILPLVDAALAELPDDLREPLVQHFLLGRPQTQVAENLGVSRATVARRLDDGIEAVRRHLKKSGVVCAAVVLTTALAQSASAAVPSTLSISLAKMAIAGPAKAATGGTIVAVLSANAKLIAAIVAAVVGVGALSYHFVPGMASWGGSKSGSAGNVRPYLSKLDLKGDGDKQDSFSLAFLAAARLYGRNVDYDTVHAMSGNSFAPGLALAQRDQKGYWHVQGWMADKGIIALGQRFGLEVKDLDTLNDADDRVMSRTRLDQAIAQELDAGNVVLACRGWRATNGVPAPWAGIVTGTSSDGGWSGATAGESATVVSGRLADVWSISPGEGTISPHQADIAALQSAIVRIRSQPPFQSNSSRAYGLAAMDEWIKAMSEVPCFCGCPGCQATTTNRAMWKENSAYKLARNVRADCTITAAYLRQIYGDFPNGAPVHIESAAGHYDRIVAMLAPAVESGPGSYETILGDLIKQRVHAAKVLVPVKSEYAAIADDLERALNITQKPGQHVETGP